MDFRSKTALVTGASSGIGMACARKLAGLGCQVAVTGRSGSALQVLARELAPAAVAAIPADLTEPGETARLAQETLARFGRVDILVNSAGVGLYAPTFDSDPGSVRRLFELNVLAPVELVRQLRPAIPAGGAIVNLSSIGGKIPLPWMGLYSASKYALNAYSDSLRIELAGAGIQVLCVCPGYVETPFRGNVLAGEIPGKVHAARNRFGITAEQCADAIVDGIAKRKKTIVVPRIGWLFVAAARLFPGIVHRRLGRMTRGEAR